ncbi:hypothetical protein N7490_000083 [Penicillium lividum]|nr:hypothetical protein N7490_000083 [Penicillium lividum]
MQSRKFLGGDSRAGILPLQSLELRSSHIQVERRVVHGNAVLDLEASLTAQTHIDCKAELFYLQYQTHAHALICARF